MEIIKGSDITEVFEEVEKKYGKEWYNLVYVEIKTNQCGEVVAMVYPISFKIGSVKTEKSVTESLKFESKLREVETKKEEVEFREKLKEHLNPKITVTISDDEMKAYITILPGIERDVPTTDEVIEALLNAGVVHGVKREVIEKIIQEKLTFQQILVAEGTLPVPPSDAMVNYTFQKCGEIFTCKKGDVLARKIPGIDGIPGTTVTGKEIPAGKGKDINLNEFTGENTKVDDEKIIALVDGQVSVDADGRISVREVLIINENDLANQHTFEFPGTIIVKCDVDGRYKFKSGKDIIVSGLISGSVEIFSDGNVQISGGFFGRNRGKIIAKGNLDVFFISDALVISEGSVYVHEYIMNSQVIAKDSIVVKGRGTISGGRVAAGKTIEARVIGTPAAISTKVSVDYEFETKKAEIEHNMRILIEEISEFGVLSGKLKLLYQNVSEKEKEKIKSALIAIEAKKQEYCTQLEELRKNLKGLKVSSVEEKQKENPKIIIKETCYSGVHIEILGESYIVTYELGPRALDFNALVNLKTMK